MSKICEKDTFCGEFLPSYLPQDDLAQKRETFSGIEPGIEGPKTIF